MKSYSFLIFFGIVLSIHLLVNYFIYYRVSAGLSETPKLLMVTKWILLLLTLSYPIGRFLEGVWYHPISNTLHWLGAFWFSGMLYSILLIIVLDLLRASNHFLSFIPSNWLSDYGNLKFLTTVTIASLVILITLGGHINAWNPRISKHTITINKSGTNLKSLKIVAASDIHLGTIIGPRKTAKLVNTINSLNPDIVLYAGDVIDEDIKPVLKQNLGVNLLKLKSKYGTFACLGNHEYIGGAESAANYLKTHGVTILKDSSTLIDNSIYIIGRDDKDKTRFSGSPRKSISELTDSLNRDKPLVLLDHQPFNLPTTAENKIDLQISGHTHHGQLWPMNYITSAIFEVSSGFKKIGESNFIVSTGYGTWGPPVRIGNRPEILEITLIFN